VIILMNWIGYTGISQLIFILFIISIWIDTLWSILNLSYQLWTSYYIVHIFLIILNIFLNSEIFVFTNLINNTYVSIIIALQLVFSLKIFSMKL
jgi:hypothetical protein